MDGWMDGWLGRCGGGGGGGLVCCDDDDDDAVALWRRRWWRFRMRYYLRCSLCGRPLVVGAGGGEVGGV